MGRELIVLSPDNPEDEADRMTKFSEFEGIEKVKHKAISSSSWPEIKELLSGEWTCIAALAGDLLKLIKRHGDLCRFKTWLTTKECHVFLYGFSGSHEEWEIMNKLTDGSITSIRPLARGVRTYGVDFDCPLTGQRFREKTFSAEESPGNMSFLHSRNAGVTDVLMTVDGLPFLLRLKMGKSQLYIAGCRQVGNIDSLVPMGTSLLSYAPSLIPPIMFLREAFREECWHNPLPKACFIIDDPVLDRNYGFLNYRDLLKILELRKMSASIAFIPWNWNRTRKDVANLFLAYPKQFSLAIHGCDHTRAEFGISNKKLLQERSQEAIRRMKDHRNISLIPFDRVMVFPQGIFSVEAMKVLKLAGYYAAVNSNPYPVETYEDPIILSDLLDGAVVKYSNFPLFLRRYPKDSALTAFEMFVGKPALLVEHHGYFRNGYTALNQLGEELNSSQTRLKWSNLERICCEACLVRRAQSGEIHVRFYTDSFRLQNNFERCEKYLLFHRNTQKGSATSVKINGQPTEFGCNAYFITIPLVLEPGESAEVKIENDEYPAKLEASTPSYSGRLRIFLRRTLSEFRDNYVETNWFLAKGLAAVRRSRKHRDSPLQTV